MSHGLGDLDNYRDAYEDTFDLWTSFLSPFHLSFALR